MERLIKRAGYLLLPVIILFFIVLLNWESITYFTVEKMALFYAGRADIEFAIGKISGSPFSTTTIENVSVRPADDQPQNYHFKTKSLTCSYDIWDLREGLEIFLARLSCSAHTPEFLYDKSLVVSQDQTEHKPGAFQVPATLPMLEVSNGIVILGDSDWDVEIRNVNSRFRPSVETGHELELQVESLKFTQDEAVKIDTGVTSLLRYADSILSIASLEMGEEQVSATGFIDFAQIDKELTGFAADLAFADSELNIEGSLEKLLLKALVSTQNFDIGELQKRLGGTGWNVSGKIRAEADLAVNLEKTEELNGSFVIGVDHGRMHGIDVQSVFLEGKFDQEIFNVASGEARTRSNHILVKEISIPMPLLQAGDPLSIIGGSRAEVTVEIADFTSLLQLLKIDEDELPDLVRPDSLIISGHLQEGAAYLDDARVETTYSLLVLDQATIPIPAKPEVFESVPIDITARFESSHLNELLAGLLGDLPFNGRAAADISITGTIKEPQAAVNLTGEDLNFREVELGSLAVKGEVQLIQETLGTLKSAQFTVTELTQVGGTGTLTLADPATGSWQQDALSMSAAFQIDEQGGVSINLNGIPGQEIAGEITVSKLDSSGWLGSFIDNSYFFKGADLEAAFKGLPNSPQIHLKGVVEEAGATDVPFPLTGSFSLQYSAKGIEIAEFTWKSYERNTLTLTGFLPYDPMADEPFLNGDLSLVGHVDFLSLEEIAVFLEPWGIAKGNVDLDMDVTGSWDQPQGHILLKAKGLQPPDTLKQYMDSAIDITCDIIAEDDAIFLKTANLESTLYTAQANGSWQHGFSLKGLMQGRNAELRGEVSADADVQLKDLNFLRSKIDGLRRLEGDLQAKVHVSGPISDPAVTGDFSLKDGEASHTFSFPMLSAINLQVELDGQSIIIKNMKLEVGGSPVELSGSINREKEAATVSLNMVGKNVLLFRNNDMRMRGDVEFDISGPIEQLAIKGTIGLTGGYYTRNIDFLSKIGSSAPPASEGGGFLFSFSEPPLKDAVFDIRITSIEPFRIRTNLVRGVLRPELSLRGTGELPFLIGAVYIDPTRVLLPSGRLQVQSGVLRFLAANPDRPELDLMAQSRVLDYDINVVSRGPLDDLVITLSSSPPLPNEDLMLLLLTGQPPRDDVAAGAQSTASTNVMLYLGRDFLTRWLDDESGATDETILDRFEMSFGRNVTKSGDQTVESSFRLSEEITGTGKKYYLTGEKDKYDAYNYGMRLVFRLE